MRKKIENLINELNAASESYYNGTEAMSNVEWDAKFDELKKLENESGIFLPNSPTMSVGAAPKIGTKVVHKFPARSLDKTKDVEQIASKMANEEALLVMWKLDGGTLQLTYSDGKLAIAATRGNGEIGQDITANAKYISGIPMTISHKESLTIRGEALMSYKDFEMVNSKLSEDEQYANPRNLANATVSMLDPGQVADRRIHFKAFGIVNIEGITIDRFDERMEWLKNQGFDPVEYSLTAADGLALEIEAITKKVADYPYPVDGLVVASNDIGRCEKLPGTGHHPNILAGYAFKWADTEAETILKEIEWSASRTGLLNPVAIFETVDLEGTKVSRASLHNFSYVREKHLRIGDRITVYKANMIIPQIRDNLSENTSEFSESEIEKITPNCPVCHSRASIHKANGVETMHCDNPYCVAKKLGSFVHFCERNCMDIEGMSEATLSKFIENGFLHSFADIFRLDRYKDEIISMEGFGVKSWENLYTAIENSKNRDIVAFLNAIGIPNIGKGQAKLIAEHFDGKAKAVIENTIFNTNYDFSVIDGIGEVINESIHSFADKNSEPDSLLNGLIEYLNISDIEVVKNTDSLVSGKTFVVTGSVNHFSNRNELKAHIEALGGKVTGSVTSKTDYLINNDINSSSGKNKKAKELGVPIISEEDYLTMSGESDS